MSTEDQVAEWLVRWEEARAANAPLPSLNQLSPGLRERVRVGMQQLEQFATTPRTKPPETPRYRFDEFLAEGGMGEVWRGYDTVLMRELALKVLRRRLVWSSELVRRFEEEARHVGQLQHPSIVPVYDMGELPDGRPFFAMKLIHGKTLAELLRARKTTTNDLDQWLSIFEHVCEAVAFAHECGLIHRDLKPSNIMLGEFGEVQVMDWGIAKGLTETPEDVPTLDSPLPAIPSNETTTVEGQVKGTPAFMAPEQARGEVHRIGKPSDVFGLGGILCVMLTGQPPFDREGDLSAAFARLDACGARCELIALAKACLAWEPEDRPADAAEVLRRLRVCGQQTTKPEPASPAAEAARVRLRQQALTWLRTEVATQEQLLRGGPSEAASVRQVLGFILQHPALVRVRDPNALDELTASERAEWEQFWRQVEELLRRASSG